MSTQKKEAKVEEELFDLDEDVVEEDDFIEEDEEPIKKSTKKKTTKVEIDEDNEEERERKRYRKYDILEKICYSVAILSGCYIVWLIIFLAHEMLA